MDAYKPLQGETIYDIAIKLYGDMTLGLSELLSNNEIDLDSSDLSGLTLYYDPTATRSYPRIPIVEVNGSVVQYVTSEGQSVYDLAIQLYGSLDAGLPVLLSKGFSLNQFVATGTTIEYTPGKESRFYINGTDIPQPSTTSYRWTEDRLVAIDAPSAIATMTTGVVESLSASDQSGYLVVGVNIMAEPLTATDSQDRVVNYGAVSITETTTVGHSQSSTSEWASGRQEPLTASESSNRTADFATAQLEAITGTHSQDRTLTTPASQSEPVGATDASSALFAVTASRTEAITASESPNATYTLGNVAISEPLTASHSQTNTLVTSGALTESATATESSNAPLSQNVSISESATATDSPDRIVSSINTATESATATDSPSRTVDFAVIGITETAAATNTQDRTSTLGNVAITEAITPTHAQDRTFTLGNVAITESATASDSSSSLATFQTNHTAYTTFDGVTDGVGNGGSSYNVDGTSNIHPFAGNSQDSTAYMLVSRTESASATDSPQGNMAYASSRTESASASDSQNAAVTLRVSVNTTSVSGTGSNPTSVNITTNSVTGTPTGGTSPYTYAWEYVSGSAIHSADSGTSATTTFTGLTDCGNTPFESVWRLKVTDNLSAIAYSDNVTVTTTNTETSCA